MRQATVRVETGPLGVATVWLARPEKNNAYDARMIAELTGGGGWVVRDLRTRCRTVNGSTYPQRQTVSPGPPGQTAS